MGYEAHSSERHRMVRGELYDPKDPELVMARRIAHDLCWRLTEIGDPEHHDSKSVLTKLLGSGGDTAIIQAPFYCDYGFNIELGERVFFNFDCVVLDECPVRIGSFSMFGPAVQIYTPLHPMNAEARRGREYGRPVEIGSDVWVGGGAIILPGVRIGNGTVVGAGSVVTRDLPESVFAAGNPCRVIRGVDDPRAERGV